MAEAVGEAGAAASGAVEGGEGFQPVPVGGECAVARWKGRDFHPAQGFGQIRVREEPGRAGEGGAEAEAAGEEDEAQAEDAVGAAGVKGLGWGEVREGTGRSVAQR